MTARFDLGFVRSEENLPGALTRPQFEADPQQRNPSTAFANEQRDYNYPNGAFTFRLPLTADQQLVSLTQLNYQDLFHPLAFAIIDQTTYNWSQEIRYINTASLGGYRNLLTAGFQYFATNQNSAQQQNRGNANAGRLIKNEVAQSANYGWYGEDVFGITSAVSLVGGLRLQYSTREIRDRLFSDPFPDVDGNDSGSVNFFGASPKFGTIWQVTPSIQVYGNASRAYQPPLLLELTAPGQIPGTLDDLNATYAWQFEIGTRGSWGRARHLGHLRLRLRGMGRDPERQHPALPGRTLHHSPLSEHPALAQPRSRGRPRRSAPHGRCSSARPRAGRRPDPGARWPIPTRISASSTTRCSTTTSCRVRRSTSSGPRCATRARSGSMSLPSSRTCPSATSSTAPTRTPPRPTSSSESKWVIPTSRGT